MSVKLAKSKRGQAVVQDLTRAGVPRGRSELLAKKLVHLAKPELYGTKVGRHYTFKPKKKKGGEIIVVKTAEGLVIKSGTPVSVKVSKARPRIKAKSIKRHK